MPEYPYITVPRALERFLTSIKTMGRPDKITTDTLPSLGFRSANHRPIVRILKFIGFLDSKNVPSPSYIDFQLTEKSKIVMAQSLRSAYDELFKLYPDAYKRDDVTLRDFFKSKTTAGEQVVALTLATFKTLCEFADFEGIIPPPAGPPPEGPPPVTPTQPSLVINLNIQLGLPPTEDVTIYDRIFESLKKHFYSK